MPSSGPITYAKNERVFCLDDGLLFEAKVLESKLSYESDKDSAPQYLVHYIGYKTEYVRVLSCHLFLQLLHHSFREFVVELE